MSETIKYKFNLEELKKLNLPDGNYSIAIRAKNSSKKASLFSKLIEYIIASDPGLEQLAAPTITLSDVILQIADNSNGLATNFDILVDGEVVASVENEVEETYTISAGNWKFYETPNFPSANISQRDISFYVTYNGRNQQQTILDIRSDGRIVVGSGNTMDADLYFNGEWKNSFDLIITFNSNQIVSKEFYDWFTTNAVKQEEASQLPAPTLFYADGELTIADYSGYSTNYTLNIFNTSSNSNTEHGGGSND